MARFADVHAGPRHAWDLGVGDFLTLGYGAPSGLEGAELRVEGVFNLVFGSAAVRGRRTLDVETTGQDRPRRFRLWEDEDRSLAAARSLLRSEARLLFGDAMSDVLFGRDPAAPDHLECQAAADGFGRWTAPAYWLETALEGAAVETAPGGDAVTANAVEIAFRRFVSEDRGHAVEILSRTNGRTEVFLVALLAERHVEEILVRQRAQCGSSISAGSNRHGGAKPDLRRERYEAELEWLKCRSSGSSLLKHRQMIMAVALLISGVGIYGLDHGTVEAPRSAVAPVPTGLSGLDRSRSEWAGAVDIDGTYTEKFDTGTEWLVFSVGSDMTGP